MKAIPVYYNGTQFRSRLEAKWAAFFDLNGWDWEYEPFDLEGWAPDFLLKGKVQALVEVKPLAFATSDGSVRSNESLYAIARGAAEKATYHADRMEKAILAWDEAGDMTVPRPPQFEILTLGLGPFRHRGTGDWALGVLSCEQMTLSDDIAILWSGQFKRMDYAANEGSYQYRISGKYDGDHHIKKLDGWETNAFWREAQNMTQWKRAA